MKKASQESFPLGQPSTSCGEKCFSWLISPTEIGAFVSSVWEKRPIVVSRDKREYFAGLISRRTVENYLKNDPDFGINSVMMARETEDGKEVSAEVDLDVETFSRMIDEEGWTAQVVHPQQKNAKIHALLERLENWSGSVWGSSLYVRGMADDSKFSAYADNVELFVLQLEGECHWRVFEGEQKLSRDSGAEYIEDDLGPAVLDEIVRPGDLLYIPRGFVHSCSSSAGYQHLSLSTYQNQSWCDLLSTTFTETLDSITKQTVAFREGLPLNWTSLFGKAVEETATNRSGRESFKSTLRSLMHQLVDAVDMDDIADQMASDFIALRTPPVVRKRPNSNDETEGKIFGPDPRLSNDLKMRIRNPSWMRIVVDHEDQQEEAKMLIFSCLDNDVTGHMKTDNPLDAEPTSLEVVGTKSLPGLRTLVSNWPEFCHIDLISRDLAGELWEFGLIETVATTDAKRQKTA